MRLPPTYCSNIVVLTLACAQVAGYSDRVTWVRNPPRLVRVERDQIIESVDASLKRLRTDYIDLLQIHWWGGGAVLVVLCRCIRAACHCFW